MAAVNFVSEDDDDEDDEQDTEEELNDLESRQIPEEGFVRDAMTEVKHKLEIS